MIIHRGSFTNLRLAPFAIAMALLACGKNNPAATENVLCPGESGVGLRVEGRATPVDVCISDQDVTVLLTSSSHYDVLAQSQLDDKTVVQLHMVFTQRPDAPVDLRLVNTVTEATSDPGAVYVSYEEIPDGGTPIMSSVILGGSFKLTFNDDKVAAGTMSSVRFDMVNVNTGDPAGSRQIKEGFFSVAVDAPPATVSTR